MQHLGLSTQSNQETEDAQAHLRFFKRIALNKYVSALYDSSVSLLCRACNRYGLHFFVCNIKSNVTVAVI